MIGKGPPGAPASSPRPSTPCPAASRCLQQLQPGVIMRRPEVLDIPGPAMREVHDLHGRRARRRLHRPQIRGHQTTIRPRLVRSSGNHQRRTRRSPSCHQDQPQKVAEVRSDKLYPPRSKALSSFSHITGSPSGAKARGQLDDGDGDGDGYELDDGVGEGVVVVVDMLSATCRSISVLSVALDMLISIPLRSNSTHARLALM